MISCSHYHDHRRGSYYYSTDRVVGLDVTEYILCCTFDTINIEMLLLLESLCVQALESTYSFTNETVLASNWLLMTGHDLFPRVPNR